MTRAHRAAWREHLLRMGREGGLTLVELLVVMLIAAVISTAALITLSAVTGVFHSQQVRIINQDDARTAVNQMARYIRMATSSADNPSTLSNSIATALPQDLEFYCDLDGDGRAEKVRYYLNGTNLLQQYAPAVWKTSPKPHWEYPAYTTHALVIQDGVRNGSHPVFTYYYYDKNHGLTAFAPNTAESRRKIVTVTVSVEVNERPELAGSNVVLATDVQLRQRYEGGLK